MRIGIRRPATTGLVIGIALTLLTACGPSGCTEIGGSNNLRIQVPAAIQKLSHTLRVELCQGERCESINFSGRPINEFGVISNGISLDGDTYSIDVDLLGKHWKADSESGLTVLGFTKKGRQVLSHTEQFRFDGYYPNGKDCDKEPYVRHGTSVSGEDLVG